MATIPYNPDKLLYKPIFTKAQLAYLEALNTASNSQDLFHPRNIEAFSIGFAHTSAVLEGNTYTAIESEILLTSGRTAPNEKKLEEAFMLKGMHNAFNYLASEAVRAEPPPFKYLVRNLHSIVSENLLSNQECGEVRKIQVFISSTEYVPSNIPQQLESGLDKIASEYEKITNPFERAVYVHQNLAYLQYFIDHNKRTARNMSAYSLLQGGKMPVMFTERSKNDYIKGVLEYYESNPANYTTFSQYFISAYENVCSRMNVNAVIEAKTATTVLKENYPTLTDSQLSNIESFKNNLMERYTTPEAQSMALEHLYKQIPDIASGKIVLPELPEEQSKGFSR